MRALVAGWFSFEEMGATAGDLLVRDLVCGWLSDGGVPHDVALAPPFTGGVDWRATDPAAYTDLVFVCGPFGDGWPVDEMIARFRSCRLTGLDLSLLQPLSDWDPFALLIERDSDRSARPDLAFLAGMRTVPVAAVVRVHRQEEYGHRGGHAEADALIDGLLETHELAVVSVDTRLDRNAAGLRSAAQVESVLARVDVVVTTRLHGLVLALRHGVPAVALDPVRGGAKVLRQATTLGWPHAVAVDAATPELLSQALRACLRPEARRQAVAVASAARATLAPVRPTLLAALRRAPVS